MSEISSADCAVLGKFPNAPANSWTEVLTSADRAAYIRVHRALGKIGQAGSEVASDELKSTTTSGFFEASGIRNQRPKDLWCAVFNRDSDNFIRMPQVFMIASGRGIELGFAASIHPTQFSNSDIKSRLRSIIPSLFRLFPSPGSPASKEVAAKLELQKQWQFRERTRLPPGKQEYESLDAFLENLKSPDGLKRASGAASRYFSIVSHPVV